MNTGERMTAILEDLGLSRNAFAGSIGVTSSSINAIVGNTYNPGAKVLMGMKKKYPQYNTEWLVTGNGEMKNSEVSKQLSTEQPGKDYLGEYLEKLEGQFERLLSQLEVKDKQIEKLMDLLGKLDLSERKPCLVKDMYEYKLIA